MHTGTLLFIKTRFLGSFHLIDERFIFERFYKCKNKAKKIFKYKIIIYIKIGVKIILPVLIYETIF